MPLRVPAKTKQLPSNWYFLFKQSSYNPYCLTCETIIKTFPTFTKTFLFRAQMDKLSAKTDWKAIDFDSLFLPGLSVDTVIFGFHDGQLMALLLQYQNTHSFALPGGFILKEENGDDAAQRVLRDRTGLSNIYLEQFHTFADNNRNDPSFFKQIMKARGLEPSDDHFLLKRFVSIGYYALVDFTKAVPASDGLADECKWHHLATLPPLIQDHERIIQKALGTLRENLDKKLVGFNLLPEVFTMGDLQRLYETVLDETFLRTSFQRKMLNLGILQKVDKKWTGAAHKAPFLYKFLPADL
jgi:8-oxo-dGTP diphosphatase